MKVKIMALSVLAVINFSLQSCFEINQFGESSISYSEQKWIDFEQKVLKISRDYFSVESKITVNNIGNLCDRNEFPNDECFGDKDEYDDTQVDEEQLYWDSKKRIFNYQKLKTEYENLPILTLNYYQDKIIKALNSMRLWILYNEFWNGDEIERDFQEIFNLYNPWENNKKIINLNNNSLNDLFDVKWEYKTRTETDSKKFIEEYNKNTQEKIFEFIAYHKYIEDLYHYYSKLDDVNYLTKQGFYKKIVNYQAHIDEDYYIKWDNLNKIKEGYGLWIKEVSS